MRKLFIISFLMLVFLTNSFAQNKTIDSLKLVLKNAKHDTTRCNILNILAETAEDGEWEKYNEQLKNICEINGKNLSPSDLLYKIYRRYQAAAISNEGYVYNLKGDYEDALRRFLTSLTIQQEIDDKVGIANSYNNIGTVYDYQGNYLEALKKYMASLAIFKEIGDKEGVAGSYNNIGIIYEEQGNYPEALKQFMASLAIAQEIDNKVGIATTHNSIGAIYSKQKNYPEALKQFMVSLIIRQKIGDKEGIATLYNQMGLIYYAQGNYVKAIKQFMASLSIRQEIGNKRGVAESYNNIGTIHDSQGNYSEALKNYKASLSIRQEIGDKRGAAFSYNNIGFVYDLQGNYTEALKQYFASLVIFEEIGDKDGISLLYQNIGKVYANQGNYRQAYSYANKSRVLHDSLFNAESTKQLSDIKTKYEVEKKEAELKTEQDKKDAVANAEKNKQRVVLYVVSGFLLLVAILAALIFKNLRTTQKQKIIIELKEKETHQQNEVIKIQKHLVEEKHKEITDSINYAERIQRSFLATEKQLNENLNNYFILFKPKDVVSGDFYWSAKLSNGNFALATADSTGHGVPGAIMSLLNVTSLERAIEHYTNPADILNHTRQTIIERLKKDGSEEGGKDGMDCSLLVFDFSTNQLLIAAANNPVWIIRNKELIEIKPDKMPVGKSDKQDQSFTTHTIELQKGDTIYTLTDGFPDQFGGDKGKKFMSKKLKELLLANVHLSIAQQKELLDSTFKNWVGDLEQVDDVTVIGIKI